MKKLLIAPAVLLSCLAVILAHGVGQWHVVPGKADPKLEARCETRLSPPGTLAIVRQPPPADFGRGTLESLPVYDPAQAGSNTFQVDLRGYDLRTLALSNRLDDLLHADFDHQTRWPVALPPEFDPVRLMELGKQPGLRMRELHARGIIGTGVGIGIIDNPLLVDHAEYRDRLRCYEEIHCFQGFGDSPQRKGVAHMHGPAVASIAVGKTVGVAPGADLYYIAATAWRGGGRFNLDFHWLAMAIDRLLEINASLPANKRIRVISMSIGWMPLQAGYGEITAAVQRAGKAGVFVISTAIEDTHGLRFNGLGRDPRTGPNDVHSYAPAAWWAPYFWAGERRFAAGWRLLVPMDSRCTASPTGPEDYVFYGDAGWSWCVPWIAGLYALACQVQPEITPEQFWTATMKSGDTVRVRNGQVEANLGPIANPVALIEQLGAKTPVRKGAPSAQTNN